MSSPIIPRLPARRFSLHGFLEISRSSAALRAWSVRLATRPLHPWFGELSLAPRIRKSVRLTSSREPQPLILTSYAAVVARSHWIQLCEAATPAYASVVGEDSPAKPAADKV